MAEKLDSYIEEERNAEGTKLFWTSWKDELAKKIAAKKQAEKEEKAKKDEVDKKTQSI
jgi:hypothetical protein